MIDREGRTETVSPSRTFELTMRQVSGRFVLMTNTDHHFDPEPEIAWDRRECDPCQKGTTGCCVNHDADVRRHSTCETW